ncbi:hypothetical protein QM012_009462 [Aureobasidium pullulans]|uniref:Stress response protein Rds1 n=1 Tax=Aureobasidium pullulans TaxID=5580 RepID=A0ABR0TGX1_AURPU
MYSKSIVASALLAGAAYAAPAATVTQISDGQVQAPGTAAASMASSMASKATGSLAAGASMATSAAGSMASGASSMASQGIYASEALSEYGSQVPGYTGANAPYKTNDASVDLANVPTSFGTNSAVNAIHTSAATGTESGAAYPLRSSLVTGSTTHGPYSGVPTTVGAVTTATLGLTVSTLPLNPTATYYNTNGKLQNPEPAPYTPAGGLGTNGSLPRYMVESDFDYESITLGLYQEWIELDCFNNGLATFSEEDFIAAGLTAEDRELIRYMAQQEEGHATLLTNMLGETAPPQCTYNYPYTTVREFVDFNQKLTRFGESGVWGFINHLDSREVGQLLAQSIATEARQQMIFRQMSGLFPMDVWFETGIPQSWSWSLLAPYISSCPENTTRLAWQNFPALHIVNQPNINRWSANDTAAYEVTGNRTSDPSISTIPEEESCQHVNVTGYGCGPAISRNRSEPLSFPGKQVNFTWDAPGLAIGPNNSYITAVNPVAGEPQYVAWAAQLNLTYTPLIKTSNNSGYTYQPAAMNYGGGEGIVNGTMFVALTDTDMFLTPFNLSMINPHVIALGLYQAG